MSDLEPVPDGVELHRGEADLDAATRQLREIPQPRAVEIADRVLLRTLAAPRRSLPVRAHAPHDHLRVSTVALTALLREHLDTHLAGAAVGRVRIDVEDEALAGLMIELYVQYGTEVMAVGDHARTLSRETVARALGTPGPDADEVSVTLAHVHVSDVTVGDPHLVDPGDETR